MGESVGPTRTEKEREKRQRGARSKQGEVKHETPESPLLLLSHYPIEWRRGDSLSSVCGSVRVRSLRCMNNAQNRPFEVAAVRNFSEGILKVVLPVETVASLPSPPSSPLPSLTSCSSSRGGPVFPVTFETSSGHESSGGGGGGGGGARAVRHDREQQVRLAPPPPRWESHLQWCNSDLGRRRLFHGRIA